MAGRIRDVEHPRDIAMRDAARQADFAAEALDDLRRADKLLAQHLQRHGLVEFDVAGAVDSAHATGPEQTLELVAAAEKHGDGTRQIGDGAVGIAPISEYCNGRSRAKDTLGVGRDRHGPISISASRRLGTR